MQQLASGGCGWIPGRQTPAAGRRRILAAPAATRRLALASYAGELSDGSQYEFSGKPEKLPAHLRGLARLLPCRHRPDPGSLY